jgi:signal transduction histidine kinase
MGVEAQGSPSPVEGIGSTGEGPDVGVALRRIVVGYRAVAAAWLSLLAAIGLAEGHVGVVAAGAVSGLALAWAVATALAPLDEAHRVRRWTFVAFDAAVAGATLVVPALLDGAAIPFTGGYPFSAVVVGAWLLGMPGALAAAAAMVGASAVRLAVVADAPLADLLSTTLFYGLAAVVLAWGMGVLRHTEQERRAVEAALVAERAERLVAEERAATAAHLHDSVLQTLALIQRRSAEHDEVAALARGQERELRDWLSGRGDQAPGQTSFVAAVKDCAEEIEGLHRVRVDVVAVGDTALDPGRSAAVAATREAIVNAAKHAKVDRISVYVEADAGGVAVYVRDRGVGFDPLSVAPDRRGIASSIVGRMERHGGTAVVRSRPGGGTEWELRAPSGPDGSVVR